MAEIRSPRETFGYTLEQEAATVVRNLKGDAPQIANYIMQRCGEFVYDTEREQFIAAFVKAAATVALCTQEPAWQPIATAPKMTYVLVFYHGHVDIGTFHPGSQRWQRHGKALTHTPTHWMPLPDPPASA